MSVWKREEKETKNAHNEPTRTSITKWWIFPNSPKAIIASVTWPTLNSISHNRRTAVTEMLAILMIFAILTTAFQTLLKKFIFPPPLQYRLNKV